MNKFLVINLIICFCLLGCATKSKEAKAITEENKMVDNFADNGFGNAVAVVQHPAGVYHKGITYVCYQGPLEDPYVASYNHKTKEWKGPYKAGVSEMGKDPNHKTDNHGKPSMLVDNAGYIHITFGGHGGTKKFGENPLGNHHYGKNKHVVTKKPFDISSWEELDNIPPFGTYNQFIKMDNGDIYLFYRHGAHRSNWVYQKSADNGRTFDEPVSFLKHKRRTDLEAEDSWYPWITKGNNDELLVVFDYHLCSDTTEKTKGLGHIAKRYNVYYMVFNTKHKEWRNVKGELLEIPVSREEADAKALVAKTPGNWTFQGVVDLDSDGNPHIGMTIGEEIPGARRSDSKQMHHYRWNGEHWIHSLEANLPEGNGDFEVKSNQEVHFYIEAKEEDDFGEVAKWSSNDDGETFKKTKVLLRKPNASFAISALIENAHPDAKLIVAERMPGTDYRKMYLLGEGGAMMRNKSEAQVLKVNLK
ncbi:BNR-4 repeat-containing protein [Aestuariivivens insulae]|uniref:BNR-4 repeat-containing protein n=1 Tax=Aestuariivivens insulae TaxID=1621988 RepID=UPI001F57BD2C|nr:BNR-4 repeat-containing protein [Aestuariivivens insulae]